jgi:hypothetical protein
MRARALPKFVVVGRTLTENEDPMSSETGIAILKSVIRAVHDFNQSKGTPVIRHVGILLDQFQPKENRSVEDVVAMLERAFV